MAKKYQLPIAIVSLGLLYAIYCFYDFTTAGVPLLETRLHEKEAALSKKSGEIRRLRDFSQNIEAVKVGLRELNLQLESALESLPRNYDLSGLLRKLSIVGFNSGITMGAFNPGTTVLKEGDFYETMPITFQLSGSFTQIMSFFDQVLRLKRIVRIEKIALHRADAQAFNPGRVSEVSARADVTAKLYRFID